MPKTSGKQQNNRPGLGCNENSSPLQPVAGGEALVENSPPAPAEEGNLLQDNVAVNSLPAPAEEGNLPQDNVPENPSPAPAEEGNLPKDNVPENPSSVSAGGGNLRQPAEPDGRPNFQGGNLVLPPDPTVSPDHIVVARILASLIPLKPFFQKSVVDSRKTFNGGSTVSSCFSDTRFCVETPPAEVALLFLTRFGINPNKPKKPVCASLGGGSAAFKKTSKDDPLKKGDKKKSSETPMVVPSTAPVVHVPLSFDELNRIIFGTEPLPISSFFDYVVCKKTDAIVTQKLVSQVCSFLKDPTLEAFINLFTQIGGKPTDRHLRNLTIFRYLLDQYFSAIDGENTRFLEKMKFFMDIMSEQNKKSLFESSRTRVFLYDLAIELLRKLGRDTNRVSYDADVAIVVLIFKNLCCQFDALDQEDDNFQNILVQLFRTMTECFLKNNAFLIEKLCFDDKEDLRKFRICLSSKSTGLSHNSLLDCDLSRFMLDPLKVWKLISGKKDTFVWMAETGTGKSTLLVSLAVLEGIQSKANVFYVGPETATMNPEYLATIIEVVCQFMESCGHERPVIRLNQSGVAKHQEGVVTVFMTRVVGQCLPLLSSVFSGTPSIIAVDDNIGLSPAQVKRLFDNFNVRQLHLCGSTIDISGCGNVVQIGGDVESSVSFCAPTFMDPSGLCFLSPNTYRVFILRISNLLREYRKVFKDVSTCGNLFFENNPDLLVKFGDIVSSFTKTETIPYVVLVKLAKLLHKGFPAFQVGKVYSVAELKEITGIVRKFIEILDRIGFVFEEECLQFPKDLSESQRQRQCKKIVDDHCNGTCASIIVTTATKGYQLEKNFVEFFKNANSPVTVVSKNPDNESDGVLKNQKKKKKEKKPTNSEENVGPLASAIDDAAAIAADAADNAAADNAAADEAAADNAAAEAASSAAAVNDDRRLTLTQILERILKKTGSVSHTSLPTRKFVLHALRILTKCGHPDAARWLESFIYGVVLLDMVMPTEFIETCLEMFDQGRMIIILAYELFPPLQSWNSKCCLMMKIVVADSVPLWVLRQIMARAGRLKTKHSGEISSCVSCLVLPNSDVSACESSISEEEIPLMIGNGEPVCAIESAIMAMICRGNFSKKHDDFIVDFLRLFSFVYKNEVCHYACVGGRGYFMDFMRFISGVLVSKFVSPFTCQILNIEERLKDLAFTKFRFGLVDVESAKRSFSSGMLALVGQHSAEVSLCLSRATGTKTFAGISHFDLPRLFKDLYEGYPDSMTSFLKLIRNLLMNLQQTQLCKCDRTVDATVSAMLLVITTTLDFVGDILSLLADKLRERDMEQFRVGFKPTLSPLDQLRDLLRRKAGLPTLQDFRAFLTLYDDTLGGVLSRLDDICAFLSPAPSGPFHDMAQKCVLLNDLVVGKKNEKQAAETTIRPHNMKPNEWVKYRNSNDYKAHRKEIDEVRIPLLDAEIRRLEDEIALIERQLGDLPTHLSEVVKYFQKRI
jgi:hypothetical protein